MMTCRAKSARILVLLAGLAFILPGAGAPPPLTLVMTHPTVQQIRNIVVLRERGLLLGDALHLIGIYHVDERTDFSSARRFVRDQRLEWVEFVTLRSKEPRDLAGPNVWTPVFRKLQERAHGILFTGGADLPPALYSPSRHLLLTDVETPLRSAVEISFLRHLLGATGSSGAPPLLEREPEFPVLAVCLGAQSLNVALGGTLWQDIPWQVYGVRSAQEVLALGEAQIHSSRYRAMLNPGVANLPPALHPLRWEKKDPWLNRFPAARGVVLVLSSHHQAIRQLAPDLQVLAKSMDGKIVEAVGHRRYPNVLGVQFHPEYAALYQPERKYRRVDGSAGVASLPERLKEYPGSGDFHRQLWSWFSRAMEKVRRHRRGSSVRRRRH